MKDNNPGQNMHLLFVIGFITMLVSLFAFFGFRDTRRIEKYGESVYMLVDSIVPAKPKEAPITMYLSYKGKSHSFTLRQMEQYMYTKGTKVKVKYMPGESEVVLPTEHPRKYMLVSAFFAGIGFLLAIFHVKVFFQFIRQLLIHGS